MKRFVILFTLVMLSSCREIPPMPAHVIWELNKDIAGCTYYPIIKDDPLTVGDGVDVPDDKCPKYGVMGFDAELDAAEVTQYIRDLQSLAKTRCK